METIVYKTIIIAFVALIAALIIIVMMVAAKSGRRHRILSEKDFENKDLINHMEEERSQLHRIISLERKNKKTSTRFWN
jgi:hypothetical protein